MDYQATNIINEEQEKNTEENDKTIDKEEEEIIKLNEVEKEEVTIIEQTDRKKKIKVIVDILNVRQDKTTDSEIVSKVYKDRIYEILDEGMNADNRTWYKIYSDLGVIGWVAGWNCIKTRETIRYKGKTDMGGLLNIDKKYQNLFLDIILLYNNLSDVLVDKFGRNYTVRENHITNTLEYNNGIQIEVSK